MNAKKAYCMANLTEASPATILGNNTDLSISLNTIFIFNKYLITNHHIDHVHYSLRIIDLFFDRKLDFFPIVR